MYMFNDCSSSQEEPSTVPFQKLSRRPIFSERTTRAHGQRNLYVRASREGPAGSIAADSNKPATKFSTLRRANTCRETVSPAHSAGPPRDCSQLVENHAASGAATGGRQARGATLEALGSRLRSISLPPRPGPRGNRSPFHRRLSLLPVRQHLPPDTPNHCRFVSAPESISCKRECALPGIQSE